MGCDIHGHVEIDMSHSDDRTWWESAGRLMPFVGRSYDSFGLLFGVRNYANVEPLFANRGFPDAMGAITNDHYDGWEPDAHSESYFTAEEILDVDWSVESDALDSRYSILDEDLEPTGSKFSLGPASGWVDIVEENKRAIESGEPVPNEDGTRYIQRRRLTRQEALSGGWDWFIHDYIEMLADRFGASNVRVVVWFDN